MLWCEKKLLAECSSNALSVSMLWHYITRMELQNAEFAKHEQLIGADFGSELF